MCVCVYIFMCMYGAHTRGEREDERGGWVVSSDLDPGNQVSSKLEPTPLAHIPADLYCCSSFDDLPRWPNLRPRTVTIARITSELSRPRQPVNRGRVTVIIETLLRDRTRRMESQPTPLPRDDARWNWMEFFFFSFWSNLNILKMICRETMSCRSWLRFREFGWPVSRNLAFRVKKTRVSRI